MTKIILYKILSEKLKPATFQVINELERLFDIDFKWSETGLKYFETDFGGSAGLYYKYSHHIEIDTWSAGNRGIIFHETMHALGLHEHTTLGAYDPKRTLMGESTLSWKQMNDAKTIGNIDFIDLLPSLGLNPQYSAPIWGTPKSDYIPANDLNNTIRGGDDSDTIFGFDGDDILYGGRGYVDSETGADQLYLEKWRNSLMEGSE